MIIYKSTNKITKKVYIGQTKHTLDIRIKSHIKESKIKSNRPFMLSINEYGETHEYLHPGVREARVRVS